MKFQWSLCLLTAAIVAGCSKSAPPPPPENVPTNNSSGNPLTAPVDYLSAVAKAKKSSEKTIEFVSVNQAVQQFFAGEGRYPRDLEEAVKEKYLGKIPTPPYGFKLDYNPTNGEVKIIADPNPPPPR